MKRKILIVLLAAGTVGGYTIGCSRMKHHHHHRRAYFEQRVADICVGAAHRVLDEKVGSRADGERP